jgi:hypothetical protein
VNQSLKDFFFEEVIVPSGLCSLDGLVDDRNNYSPREKVS